ncbi:MAG: hypothetical protein KKB13_18830, partial [Chloroflexi bacterium]|nr:hypothetical protein [Chloroflexota bacterium]
NWDELCDYYLVPGEQDALEQLLSQYLAVIERNKRASYRKAWLLRIGLTLLPFLILALVALATHSLWLDYLP